MQHVQLGLMIGLELIIIQTASHKQCCLLALFGAIVQEIKHKEDMHTLLRTISHEIRNPLHGVLGNTQALLDILCEAGQQAAARDTLSSNEHNASDASTADYRGCYTCDTAAAATAAASARVCSVSGPSMRPMCIRSPIGADLTQCHKAIATTTIAETVSRCTLADAADIMLSMQDSSSCNSSAVYTREASKDNDSSVMSAGQLLGTKSLRKLAAAKKREACIKRDDTSSSSVCHYASFRQLSSKLNLINDMVTEIHECALHQVSTCKLMN
jgi:His Kinase A (phospho-acceptor) domain